MNSGPVRPRPGTGALGGPLVHLETTGSTNDHARDLALAGAPDGTVVIAEEQTAGRGRQGRSWTAPRGHALTLSVLRRFETELELLPLAVALAVCQACEAAAAVACQIKWPNDIWVTGRKLAGILIETRPREQWAVIGIGINVGADEVELPPDLPATATSLRIAGGTAVNRDQVLAALFGGLGAWFGKLDARHADLLSAYRRRDALKGRWITWTAGGRELWGEAGGVDEHGNLIVFNREGERLVLSAGEVHLTVDAD